MNFTKKIIKLEKEVKEKISPSGGLLHIIIEDCNYEASCIMYCINQVIKSYQKQEIPRWQYQLYMELSTEYIKNNKKVYR